MIPGAKIGKNIELCEILNCRKWGRQACDCSKERPSNGWLSIKCHSFVRICFKLDTDGLYCVLKVKFRLFSFFLFLLVG